MTNPLPESAVEQAVRLAVNATPHPGLTYLDHEEYVENVIRAALPAIREAVGREYAGLVEKWRARSDGERSGPVSYAMRTCADELAALTTTQEARHDER